MITVTETLLQGKAMRLISIRAGLLILCAPFPATAKIPGEIATKSTIARPVWLGKIKRPPGVVYTMCPGAE